MLHGNRGFILWHLGEELPDVVIQRELALFRQQRDAHRRELLGHRTDAEHRLGGDGDFVFQVGHAVAPGIDDPSILEDTHGEPW